MTWFLGKSKDILVNDRKNMWQCHGTRYSFRTIFMFMLQSQNAWTKVLSYLNISFIKVVYFMNFFFFFYLNLLKDFGFETYACMK